LPRVALVGLIVFFAAAPILAQSGAVVYVSARVETQCRVFGGKLDFGTYNPIGAQASQPLDAAAHFEVLCSPGAQAQLSLRAGLHPVADRRRMVAPGHPDQLQYDLYVDSGRTRLWTPATAITLQQLGVQPLRVAVFGRIPHGQDVTAGSYEDSVLIEVRF